MMHPIENIMKSAMEEIKEMVDVNTIIGDPILTGNETMILPVSKVSLGFLSGGGEYGMGNKPVRKSAKVSVCGYSGCRHEPYAYGVPFGECRLCKGFAGTV